MTTSNSDLEDRWINLWSDLSELRDSIEGQKLYLIDWTKATEDELKGWLQDSAYDSNQPVLETIRYEGKEVIRGFLLTED